MPIPATVPTLDIEVTFQEPSTLAENSTELTLRTPIASISADQLALFTDVDVKYAEIVSLHSQVSDLKDDVVVLKTSTETSESNAATSAAAALADKNATATLKSDVETLKSSVEATAASINGGVHIVGDYDASGGVAPPVPATGAAVYTITVAGTINTVDYNVGDLIVYDNVNAQWFRLKNSGTIEGTVSIGDITGLGTVATYDVPASGNAGTTEIVIGTDTRLSDAREWSAATVSSAEALNSSFTERRAWTSQRVHEVAAYIFSNAAVVTTVTNGLMIASDKVKLDGIATGATANAADADLRDRTTHTGEQPISSITGLSTQLVDLAGDISNVNTALVGKVAIADKGVANGVATLDATGKVPVTQIPSSSVPAHDHNDLYYTKAESNTNFVLTGSLTAVADTANDALTNSLQAQADADAALEAASAIHGFSWIVLTDAQTSVTVENRDGIFTDTTSQSQTVILPASPVLGDTIAISDAVGNWDTNVCVVERNGHKIMGLDENLNLNVANQTVYLTFSNITRGWRLT